MHPSLEAIGRVDRGSERDALILVPRRLRLDSSMFTTSSRDMFAMLGVLLHANSPSGVTGKRAPGIGFVTENETSLRLEMT